MEQALLNSITHPLRRNELIYLWEYIELPDHHARFYYIVDDPEKGFDFYVVRWMGIEVRPETENNEWNPEFLDVEPTYYGSVTFDGLRHLYMGDEGYLNYPKPKYHAEIFKIIAELEDKHCPGR